MALQRAYVYFAVVMLGLAIYLLHRNDAPGASTPYLLAVPLVLTYERPAGRTWRNVRL